MMRPNNSFHIYDGRRDYSVTNIRDILFDVDKREQTDDTEIIKLRTSRSQLRLIGKGGCGIRHFVAINLALAYANMMVNYMSFLVALPAMLNHTAIKIHIDDSDPDYSVNFFDDASFNRTSRFADGPFDWPDMDILVSCAAPHLGYIAATIPAALLARRYGAKNVLATGLLIQSFFQMMVPAAAETGFPNLWMLLIAQKIAMAPLMPCIYMLLSNWIPPCERSRSIAVVGCGLPIAAMVAQYLGTTICECELCGGWAALFYLFAGCSVLLSMFFVFFMWEDPEKCPVISDREKNYILNELSRFKSFVPKQIPWLELAKSRHCWALWISHIAQSIYEITIEVIVPQYMIQILNTQDYNFVVLLLPGLLMVTSGLISSVVADCLIMRGHKTTLQVRKLFNSLALFGTAIGVSLISHTGYNIGLTLAIHNLTALLNGVNTSGFRVNYLEVSHNFSGILVSIGKTLAIIASLLWLTLFGFLTLTGKKSLRKWQLSFFIVAVVLAVSASIFLCIGSSYRQHWDLTAITGFNKVKGRHSVSFTAEELAPAGGPSTNVAVKDKEKTILFNSF